MGETEGGEHGTCSKLIIMAGFSLDPPQICMASSPPRMPLVAYSPTAARIFESCMFGYDPPLNMRSRPACTRPFREQRKRRGGKIQGRQMGGGGGGKKWICDAGPKWM